MATTVSFSANGIRAYGHDLEQVWGAWADEDIIELAVAARAALDALAKRLDPDGSQARKAAYDRATDRAIRDGGMG